MVNKSFKHWLVLILCCGLSGAAIGISINTSGVFYTPVSQSLRILRGSFAMHMTIFSMVTAISSLFIPRLMEKYHYKLLLLIGVIVGVISTAAMGCVSTIPMFYLLGAIRGMSTSLFAGVPLTMIINNWFVEKHGLATSIVLSFSGIMGSFLSPILSTVINEYGWQTGYYVKAVLIFILCLPALLYPFSIEPRNQHLLPYGYIEKKEKEEIKIEEKNFKFTQISFIAFFIFGLFVSSITSVTQHLPGYGQSLGYNATIAATLLSAGMMGNIISKLVLGFLSDLIGTLKSTFIIIGVLIVGVVLLMLGISPSLSIIGAFFFGFAYGLGAVALPLLTKYFFGQQNYSQVYPKISFASNLGAALSISLVGYIYDYFGSYLYAFLLVSILIFICLMMLMIINKQTNNKKI